MDTVGSQLDGNSYQLMLLKAMAAGLVALISLSQLGTDARFGSGGPRPLLPLSISAVVAAAVLFGLAYGNFSYATAQLNARMALPEDGEGRLSAADPVPHDIAGRVSGARTQMGVGVLATVVASGLYLSSVWWPK